MRSRNGGGKVWIGGIDYGVLGSGDGDGVADWTIDRSVDMKTWIVRHDGCVYVIDVNEMVQGELGKLFNRFPGDVEFVRVEVNGHRTRYL